MSNILQMLPYFGAAYAPAMLIAAWATGTAKTPPRLLQNRDGEEYHSSLPKGFVWGEDFAGSSCAEHLGDKVDNVRGVADRRVMFSNYILATGFVIATNRPKGVHLGDVLPFDLILGRSPNPISCQFDYSDPEARMCHMPSSLDESGEPSHRQFHIFGEERMLGDLECAAGSGRRVEIFGRLAALEQSKWDIGEERWKEGIEFAGEGAIGVWFGLRPFYLDESDWAKRYDAEAPPHLQCPTLQIINFRYCNLKGEVKMAMSKIGEIFKRDHQKDGQQGQQKQQQQQQERANIAPRPPRTPENNGGKK